MKPVIEWYNDIQHDCTFVRLCLPHAYLVSVRRPRLTLFWQLVKICWAGCYAKAPTVSSDGKVPEIHATLRDDPVSNRRLAQTMEISHLGTLTPKQLVDLALERFNSLEREEEAMLFELFSRVNPGWHVEPIAGEETAEKSDVHPEEPDQCSNYPDCSICGPERT